MPGLSETDFLEPRLTRFIENFDDLKVTKTQPDPRLIKPFSVETKNEPKYPNSNISEEEILTIPGNFSGSKPEKK